MAKGTGKAYYMISVVAQRYNIHPQTLRLYEREGLLKPSRTDGNTRLYSDDDLERLETILSLTRDLGVNLAGVEIVLNMRERIEQMQGEVNEFMQYVKREMVKGLGDWEQRLNTAMVKSAPGGLVLHEPRPAALRRGGDADLVDDEPPIVVARPHGSVAAGAPHRQQGVGALRLRGHSLRAPLPQAGRPRSS